MQKNQKDFRARGLTSPLTEKETEAQRDYKVMVRVTQVVSRRADIQISRRVPVSPECHAWTSVVQGAPSINFKALVVSLGGC